MPLYLSPPSGRWKNYRVRGSHFGVKVNRSTGTADKREARKALEISKRQIEQGLYVGSDAPTFASGMIAYVNAGHDDRFLDPLLVDQTFRFAWGFPERLACAILWNARANEHPTEGRRSQDT
jgi:hypothetical protein